MKKRTHAVTPTDRGPKPDRQGLYKAEDFARGSNPHYEYSPPRSSKCGRFYEVDGGKVHDASKLGRP